MADATTLIWQPARGGLDTTASYPGFPQPEHQQHLYLEPGDCHWINLSPNDLLALNTSLADSELLLAALSSNGVSNPLSTEPFTPEFMQQLPTADAAGRFNTLPIQPRLKARQIALSDLHFSALTQTLLTDTEQPLIIKAEHAYSLILALPADSNELVAGQELPPASVTISVQRNQAGPEQALPEALGPVREEFPDSPRYRQSLYREKRRIRSDH